MKRFERRRILFVQLPLLDNDPACETENPRQAAMYLRHAIEQSRENLYFEPAVADPEIDRLDNRNTVEAILDQRPGVIAATLYVWNVERTLRIMREVRKRRPDVLFLAGGPEVARRHPFLYASRIPDVVVSGEGEPVLGDILSSLRRGGKTDYRNVAWRSGRCYQWGSQKAPEPDLSDMLPPANDPMCRPDAQGIAYMETTRGCPGQCAFCRYRHQRTGLTGLAVSEVLERICVLRRRGAREIRFIDPTFNSHPRFMELLAAIARINADRSLRFFAEIRADTITPGIAELLAAANVCQIEVGIQSGDPRVLRAVGRPPDLSRAYAGIELLAERGLATTLDAMCGLPEQTPDDVRNTVAKLARVRGGDVQLLHTLLIPGSDLREHRRRYGLTAQRRPPYRVIATETMSAEQIGKMDAYAAERLGRRLDSPARRFVGFRLSDIFPEKVDADEGPAGISAVSAGRENRRAILFRRDDLFAVRDRIVTTVRKVLRREPDMLWQFVLCPEREEPLDLLDSMIETIDRAPGHFLDRLHVPPPREKQRVARRIFILLRPGRRYDRSWKEAAEALLSRAFY